MQSLQSTLLLFFRVAGITNGTFLLGPHNFNRLEAEYVEL